MLGQWELQTMAKLLVVEDEKNIRLGLAALYQEHRVQTAGECARGYGNACHRRLRSGAQRLPNHQNESGWNC